MKRSDFIIFCVLISVVMGVEGKKDRALSGFAGFRQRNCPLTSCEDCPKIIKEIVKDCECSGSGDLNVQADDARGPVETEGSGKHEAQLLECDCTKCPVNERVVTVSQACAPDSESPRINCEPEHVEKFCKAGFAGMQDDFKAGVKEVMEKNWFLKRLENVEDDAKAEAGQFRTTRLDVANLQNQVGRVTKDVTELKTNLEGVNDNVTVLNERSLWLEQNCVTNQSLTELKWHVGNQTIAIRDDINATREDLQTLVQKIPSKIDVTIPGICRLNKEINCPELNLSDHEVVGNKHIEMLIGNATHAWNVTSTEILHRVENVSDSVGSLKKDFSDLSEKVGRMETTLGGANCTVDEAQVARVLKPLITSLDASADSKDEVIGKAQSLERALARSGVGCNCFSEDPESFLFYSLVAVTGIMVIQSNVIIWVVCRRFYGNDVVADQVRRDNEGPTENARSWSCFALCKKRGHRNNGNNDNNGDDNANPVLDGGAGTGGN